MCLPVGKEGLPLLPFEGMNYYYYYYDIFLTFQMLFMEGRVEETFAFAPG